MLGIYIWVNSFVYECVSRNSISPKSNDSLNRLNRLHQQLFIDEANSV